MQMILGALAGTGIAAVILHRWRDSRRTTDAPIAASQWPAAARTTQTTSASRPSPTQGVIKSGLAGLGSQCAHDWTVDWDLGRMQTTEVELLINVTKTGQEGWCTRCGALWSHGEIHVPAVAEGRSILVRPDLLPSIPQSTVSPSSSIPPLETMADQCEQASKDRRAALRMQTERVGP